MASVDFIVVGAGMAGASVAAELSKRHSVLLFEAEERPGYHSTGRSGAVFGEIYGGPLLRRLCQASRSLLFCPPQDFAPHPLVKPRGAMLIANAAQQPAIIEYARQPDVQARATVLDKQAARAICPLLREDYVVGAVHDATAAEIDVHGLHQAYLRMLNRNGGRLLTSKGIDAMVRKGGLWEVRFGEETWSAAVVINAAGAWADTVAAFAAVDAIGLNVFQRTAILVEPPAGIDVGRLPVVLDPDEQFYFKPDAGLLMLSPADEKPVEPGDAQPDEIDIAIAVDRVLNAADIPIRSIRHRWAGLRSFVADRLPVVGFDPRQPGFFWLAGQGGHGIAAAPALARIAAALACEAEMPGDIEGFDIDVDDLSPSRLRGQGASDSSPPHGY